MISRSHLSLGIAYDTVRMICVVVGTEVTIIFCSLVTIILQNVKDADVNDIVGLEFS
jgi:hypothetical protein